MIIEKLSIYGFGKHEDLTIELGPGINVLYGLNEAGKTTIQQFILHVLFGFPQRNSTLLRYEPKSGGKYGGQIQLIDEVYGTCVVERIRGKSAGEVTVHFQDGTTGNEEQLKVLLRHYDRGSFESIFSFSLLQLQGFEKMNQDELSRTLLASGTTGVDSLLLLEKKMEKTMNDLFKKSGKVPEMNVKIAELRELELDIKVEQEKVEEYTPAINRINYIDAELLKLHETKRKIDETIRNLKILRQALPLYIKKELLENELKKLGMIDFPTDGIRRFESLSERLKEITAKKQRIEDEIKELEKRKPLEIDADRRTEMELLLAQESEWHYFRTTSKTAEDEIRRLEGMKHRIFDRLGMKDKELEIQLSNADVSIRKEEEMHDLITELSNCKNQITFAEQRQHQIEKDIEENQTELVLIENEGAPSLDEIERVNNWGRIQEKLAEAKAYVLLGGKTTSNNTHRTPLFLVLVAVILFIFTFIQKELTLGIVGLIIFGFAVYLFLKSRSVTKKDPLLDEMTEFIRSHSGKEEEMEQLKQRIQVFNQKREVLKNSLTKSVEKLQVVETELEMLQIEEDRIESSLIQFLGIYGFDGLPSPGIVPELFRMIREWQEIMRDLLVIRQEKSDVDLKIGERIKEIESVLRKMVPPEAIYEMLRRESIQLNEEIETSTFISSNVDRLIPLLTETTLLVDSTKESLNLLLREAGAENEEDLYLIYDNYLQIKRLKDQLTDTKAQLSANNLLELNKGMTEEELRNKGNSAELELLSINEQINELINEKAELVHKTKQLLTDETYSQKLQLFEMKKAEFGELAIKWSQNKAISEAIKRTMSELKEKKLPEVLKSAAELFCNLTDENYSSLVVTNEGYFEAVQSNGIHYPVVELSQATKEQAYISLRLALAASLKGSAPFPIIMDDPFVHFDGKRLSNIIETVSKLGQQRQFIYFTCHKDMKEKWQDANVLDISRLGREQEEFIR
ncbi:AAA family ATPase [Sporosarcina siberiensis]|uniref:AAA family ATPase n=1 Tax=Sporosarcina siberiensis TaxID=1365606 RepID=A0ABW4SCA1_9BACL